MRELDEKIALGKRSDLAAKEGEISEDEVSKIQEIYGNFPNFSNLEFTHPTEIPEIGGDDNIPAFLEAVESFRPVTGEFQDWKEFGKDLRAKNQKANAENQALDLNLETENVKKKPLSEETKKANAKALEEYFTGLLNAPRESGKVFFIS